MFQNNLFIDYIFLVFTITFLLVQVKFVRFSLVSIGQKKRLLIAKLLGIQSSLPFLFLQVSKFSLRMGIFFKVVVKEIFSSNSYFIIFTTHSIAFIASSHKGINCID